MTISTKASKSDSSRDAGARERDNVVKPVTGVFRTFYKGWKYGTIIGVVFAIVLVGVMILGEVSEEVAEDRKLAALYKASTEYSETTDGINKLLNNKKSSYISNRVINLYLSEKFNKNDNLSDLDTQFEDLELFADFFLSQRYQAQNFAKFPLAMYQKNFLQVVDEPITSKGLKWLKTKVQKFFEENGFSQNDNVKELKWSRVKKLVDNAKFWQITELLKNNFINWAWQWIDNSPQVIVLLTDESTISKSNQEVMQQNKKLLKKWIQINQNYKEIIILSRFSININYNENKEDIFKSLQVTVGLDKFDKTSFCKYLSQQEGLSQSQCTLMKSNFNSFHQLYRFVNRDHQDNSILLKSSQNQELLDKLLQKVCDKGHVKYYFYENQQNVNKVLQRNKKGKKSRLDREMDALLVKFSQLKQFLGITRIKDVYNTLNTGLKGQQEDKLTLTEVNTVGLLYDFENHELRWRNEHERIAYEMSEERSCKGERFVEQEIKEQENRKKKKEKEENQRQEDEQTYEDEEQVVQQQIEEEYEQNPIYYRNSEQDKDGQEEAEGQTELQLEEEREEQNGVQQEEKEEDGAIQEEQEDEQEEQGTEQQGHEDQQQNVVTQSQNLDQQNNQQESNGEQGQGQTDSLTQVDETQDDEETLEHSNQLQQNANQTENPQSQPEPQQSVNQEQQNQQDNSNAGKQDQSIDQSSHIDDDQQDQAEVQQLESNQQGQEKTESQPVSQQSQAAQDQEQSQNQQQQQQQQHQPQTISTNQQPSQNQQSIAKTQTQASTSAQTLHEEPDQDHSTLKSQNEQSQTLSQ